MKKLILILVMLFLFIVSLNNVNAYNLFNISASEDSWVSSGTDTNYGNALTLRIRQNIYLTYLQYYIDNIPDGEKINNAELCLYAYSVLENQTTNVYLVNNTFDENILDGLNDPYSDVIWDINDSLYIDEVKYYCFDVTSLVQASHDEGDYFVDFMLNSNNIPNYIEFRSKEYGGNKPTFLIVNSSTDYSQWCQYNALKGGVVTTCNNFKVGYYCDEIIDESMTGAPSGTFSEWVTDDTFTVPPNVAHTVITMENAFNFDRVEVWGRGVKVNGINPKNYEISVYSPEMNTWYLLIDEDNVLIKEGCVNTYDFGGLVTPFPTGMAPYVRNIDTTNIGNITISKVEIKVYDTLVTVNYPLYLNELAFCMMGENESVVDVTDYSVAGIGVGCDSNDDCECRLCEYGFCTLRTTNMDCVINGSSRDDCCLSGECSGGKCTKAGMWNSIEASKEQQFGDDTKTNNFIALFFIIGIAGFLMYHGNVIAGIFALYMLSIFFVVVGWLSPFLLLGMIITGLIAVVFKIMTGHSTD